MIEIPEWWVIDGYKEFKYTTQYTKEEITATINLNDDWDYISVSVSSPVYFDDKRIVVRSAGGRLTFLTKSQAKHLAKLINQAAEMARNLEDGVTT